MGLSTNCRVDLKREFSFVIPCFDEHPEVLDDTINKLIATLDGVDGITYEIIVVDDGSKKFSYDDPPFENVYLIRHPDNIGYGASLMTGISHACYGWIGIVDADGTYPVEYFTELLKHTDSHDMVVGKRNWGDIQFLRRLPKLILTKVASFIADYNIPDLNSGMRLFKKDIVRKYTRIFPQRFSFTTTITMICITNFYDVKFIDIPYHKRIGSSSIHPIRDTAKFFSLTFRLALYFKPLRFFIPLSFFTFVLAVLRGARDVWIASSFGGLTLVLFFMAFQIFFFGLIAEIINKK